MFPGHPAPVSAGTKHTGNCCTFDTLKGMVVVNADVVFNCELASVCSYFMWLWSSYESLPEASCETFTWANHLWLQWPSSWVTGTAVLFAGSVSPVLLTKHRWIKYK